MCKDEAFPEKDKVLSTFFAKVRITVYAKEGQRSVIREGGDQFGLTLYDKEQRNVGRFEARQIEGHESFGQRL